MDVSVGFRELLFGLGDVLCQEAEEFLLDGRVLRLRVGGCRVAESSEAGEEAVAGWR